MSVPLSQSATTSLLTDRRRLLRSSSGITSSAPPLQSNSPLLSPRCRIMGRKAGGLFINSKRFTSMHKPCMKEMTMFMACMATNNSNVQACAEQKELLNACIESQSKKNRKSLGSINYQMQRLSRGRK